MASTTHVSRLLIRFAIQLLILIFPLQLNSNNHNHNHILIEAKVKATQMSSRIITTKFGKLRGVLVTLPNPTLPQVEAYLGLQYASTLGKELRFMPPTSPINKWDGTKVALSFQPVCPQPIPDIDELEKKLPLGRVDHFKRLIPFLERQSEDCLHLNIYVPNKDNSSRHLLPVVVFIHGETYSVGTGNAYDGSVLAAYGQVIVVTLNFRLGVLGFLSTGDSNAAGNYALLDQVAALHWISENIEAFGGDRNKVTLMGQGYGAAMVHLLLVSPVTKGHRNGKNLFHRAIIQSGSALSSWAITPNPVHYTELLAKKVNCSDFTTNSADLLQCLKSKPWEELVAHTDIEAPKYYSAFGPVIDRRSVLPSRIRSLMNDKDSVFSNTAVLVGLMKNEGFLMFNQTQVDNGVTHEEKVKILRTYVRNLYHYHRQKIYEIILHHYSDWEKPADPKTIRDELMELLGDAQYVAPLMELTNSHAKYGAGTFFYSFSYPSRLDSYPRWAGGVQGDDMTYIFGAPLTDGIDPFTSSFTRSEKMLTEAVMTYWTNFIKSGNPNLPLEQDSAHGKVKNRFSDVDWPTFSEEEPQYLHIETSTKCLTDEYCMRPTIRDHYRASKMALWLDLIPKIHKSDDLDLKYHLLDDYNNASSFETHGTQPVDIKRLFPPPPISPPFPPSTTSTTTVSTRIRSPMTTTTTTTLEPQPNTPTFRPRVTWPPKPTEPPPQNATAASSLLSGGIGGMDARLSMSVTLAVGCSLLFLNIVIFAGVYYQKDRMRMETKLRKLELEKEKEATLGPESEGVKSSTGPDSDTNSSSMATPPIPPPLNRCPPPQNHPHPQQLNHPQQHPNQHPINHPNTSAHAHNNTMPKTAIPVMPPQAPYRRSPHLPQRPIDLHHHPHTQHQPPPHPHHHPLQQQGQTTLSRHQLNMMSSQPDMIGGGGIMVDDKQRHSSSADSGTDVNNHCPNPSTVV